MIKNKKISLKYPLIIDFLSYWKNSLGTQKWVWINHGKQATGDLVIEVLRYKSVVTCNNNLYTEGCFKCFKQKTVPNGMDDSQLFN